MNAAPDGGQIINSPENGVELPHTGGIGYTIFYILGGILIAGSGAFLIRRRRKLNN